MSVILNLLEYRIARFNPVVVDVVESLVESFHGYPFNHKTAKNYGSFENATKVYLKIAEFILSNKIIWNIFRLT